MDSEIRVYKSLKEVKADEYRYWQSRPVHERMSAAAEMSLAAYGMERPEPDIRRLISTAVCIERPKR